MVVSQLEAQVTPGLRHPRRKIDKVFDSLLDSSIRIIPGTPRSQRRVYGRSGRPPHRKAGVALVTSGPGCSNLITGMATANSEGDPVVALGGAVKRGQGQTGPSEYGYRGDVQPGPNTPLR
jgi:acetolactate synthase-1/2/3 large subunit